MTRTHVHSATRFLAGPSENGPPIVQTVFVPAASGDTERPMDVLVEIGAGDPEKLELGDLRRLTRELLGQDITAFESPYQERYAYGPAFLNSRHPTVQLLLRIACASRLALASGKISVADAGRMGDRLWATRVDNWEPVKRLPQRLREALDLARNLRLVDFDIDSIALPQPDDFVPGTIVERGGELRASGVDILRFDYVVSKEDSSEFGMPLS